MTTLDKKPKKPSNIGANRQKDGTFGPGNCANPNGKPEGSYSLLAILRKELAKCPEGQDKKSYGELIVRRMLKEAIEKGDVQQIKLIWNYIEGMPKESHDLTSSGEKIVFLPYEIITKHDINANSKSNSSG